MMGCSASVDTQSVNEDIAAGPFHWHSHGVNTSNLVKDFVRLDEQIIKLEATCAGPRLATIEAWLEHLQTKRDALLGLEAPTEDLIVNDYDDAAETPAHPINAPPQQANGVLSLGNGLGVERLAANNNDSTAITPTKDLANLALNLGVVNNVQKASTHEDFFANLSESALHISSSKYYGEILEHSKVRLKALTESYAELNELYVNHDGIIAFISGGTYMSRVEEQIDMQLETARDIRNKLGSALEQWRISGILLRACANAATQCLQQWQQLAKITNAREKIQAALECRHILQASLISLGCAQLSLPHVEFKHVSNRQVLAVKHCNTYMITDIANVSRYDHTTKVFTTFEGNMAKASMWLYETFSKTLRKDFDKAEDTVLTLAKSLREHRAEIFTAARK